MTVIGILRGRLGCRGLRGLFGGPSGVLGRGALCRRSSWRDDVGGRFSGRRFDSGRLRNRGSARSLVIGGRGAASLEDDSDRLDHPAKLAAALLAHRQRIIAKALPPLDYLATNLACVDIGWHWTHYSGGQICARREPRASLIIASDELATFYPSRLPLSSFPTMIRLASGTMRMRVCNAL